MKTTIKHSLMVGKSDTPIKGYTRKLKEKNS